MNQIYDKRAIVEGKCYLIYIAEDDTSKEIRIVRCSKCVGMFKDKKYGTTENYLLSESGRWSVEPYKVRSVDGLLGEFPLDPAWVTIFELTDDEVIKHLVMENI